MKKLIAMLLVVMIAASGAMTCSAAGLLPSITVTNTVNCDRDAVREILTDMGVGERKIDDVDAVLAILDAANEKLVVANNGIELDLNLNDTTVFALAGELSSGGVAIGSTLFPNHVMTLSPLVFLGVLGRITNMAKVDAPALPPEGVLLAALHYSGKLADKLWTAVSSRIAERGEYAVDGEPYNARITMILDTRVILDDAVGAVNRFIHSGPFNALRGLLRRFGIDVDFELPEIEGLPAASIVLYQNLDEAGEAVGVEYGVLKITELDGTTPFAEVGVRLGDGNLRMNLEVPGHGISADLEFNRSEDGAIGRLNVAAGEFYLGIALEAELGDETRVAFYVYCRDPKAPVLSGELSVVKGGERAYDIAGGNKTVFSVDGVLAGRRAFRSTASLAADILFHGIGDTMDTLHDALAEIRRPAGR